MSYCPRCGSKVSEEIAFCPKCGAPLKGEKPPAQAVPAPAPYRGEKAEKHEKGEKREKAEKYEKREKREFGVIGWLIGGLILILLGLMFYLQVINLLPREVIWALFFIIVGVIIIVGAIYVAMMASRRHPKT